MNLPLDLTALILDMDGVIIDSEPLHLEAFSALMSDIGVPYTPEMHARFLGMKDSRIMEILIAEHKITHEAAALLQRKEDLLHNLVGSHGQAMPGLEELIGIVKQKGWKLALASSSSLPTINLVIDTLNIRSCFDTIASGDEVEHGKPAPDVFLLAAQRLETDPHTCLVIEDTYNGIRAAKAAGMFCIAVPCKATEQQDHSQADWQTSSLLAVQEALKQVEFAQ